MNVHAGIFCNPAFISMAAKIYFLKKLRWFSITLTANSANDTPKEKENDSRSCIDDAALDQWRFA
jgi:hypothetical protein